MPSNTGNYWYTCIIMWWLFVLKISSNFSDLLNTNSGFSTLKYSQDFNNKNTAFLFHRIFNDYFNTVYLKLYFLQFIEIATENTIQM